MMTPTAPASSAFSAFAGKVHVPRSTKAKLPATAAALVSGEQPSVVAGRRRRPRPSASTTSSVIPVVVEIGTEAGRAGVADLAMLAGAVDDHASATAAGAVEHRPSARLVVMSPSSSSSGR